MEITELDKRSSTRTINEEIKTLEVLRDQMDGSLTNALDLMINSSGRIIITGMGKSGHIGKKIVASVIKKFLLCL